VWTHAQCSVLDMCKWQKRLVDVTGIEPVTPRLRSRCSEKPQSKSKPGSSGMTPLIDTLAMGTLSGRGNSSGEKKAVFAEVSAHGRRAYEDLRERR
jgi:hypothetical protein